MNMMHAPSLTLSATPEAAWNWRLKIYTLGRFALVVNNTPLRFTGKVQKRPLELLKALIALGGRQVSWQKLSEFLWPDADGDTAKISFNTTLHRLRKLIGSEAIAVQDGKVTLDDQYCWSDVVSFERQLSELERQLADPATPVANVLGSLEHLACLYQGPFLGMDGDYPWALLLRERLRNRWLGVLRRAIQFLGASGHCTATAHWYERAIMVNPLTEEFYRGYISCLAAQGQRAEALVNFERCRRVLATYLGVEPSAKTQAVRDAVVQDDAAAIATLCAVCRRGNVS